MSRRRHPHDDRAAEPAGTVQPETVDAREDEVVEDRYQAPTDEPDKVMVEEMEALRRTTFANR